MIARLLISRSQKKLKEEIAKNLASQFGIKTNINHPDILFFEPGQKLGIAESRKIKEHFSLKPHSAKGRFVAIEDANLMTIEAQNALLKTIEELPKESILILGASSDANLLPTVISRCEIIYFRDEDETEEKVGKIGMEDLENLLKADITERFAYIEKIKNKEEFLNSLVIISRRAFLTKSSVKNDGRLKNFLNELLEAEKLAKQNVNIRAILEYLMLKMPKSDL